MTTLSFRRRYFRQFYRSMLRRLKPARPLTAEIAERWRDAMENYRPDNAVSARRVAKALEVN
jgi:hypothetical protein